ncbi:hypothetical protein [Alicyclobacillus sp. SO9]|uniref:hypothetical protein n=1 Tax=Alicyclobacillus sp. SO9 TaxID=2665646 RepID=UPI0018E81671|nr:hypothetical protein [Alicyclobacillus sp. SO9]QQE80406.1 hypothetical protein GI364_08305 [Alicyclobacillus sp. SO9]
MKKLMGLFILMLGLLGCAAHSQLQNALPLGTVLGWHSHLYKIVKSVAPKNVGKKLGTVTYHGKVSGSFTVFESSGKPPSNSVVFETSTGQYYQANIEAKNS